MLDEEQQVTTEALAAAAPTLAVLDDALSNCRACPRLVAWREEAAATKRRAFRDWDYWGRPITGFGPGDAAIAVIGLAPAAHGGNRTGRAFTGDAAGDFLYAAMYAVGLASQPTATHKGDGLTLLDTRVTMPVHCAPPDNKPTTQERDTCRPWLAREFSLMRPTLSVVVTLGAFAWQSVLPVLADAGWSIPRPRPKFSHGAHTILRRAVSERDSVHASERDREPPESLHLLGTYHPSQRNTFTGTLTPTMLEDVLATAAKLAQQ